MTDLILSSLLAGDSPKSMKVGLSVMTKLRLKSIPEQELTSALLSETVLQPITLLKMGVRCPCMGENKLMVVLNGWAFLTLWGPLDLLGLPISWILMRIGGAKVPVPVRTWVVTLEDTLTVFISIWIGLLVTFQFTTGGSLKTCAALDSAPMTISSKRTVRTPCKAPPHSETPSAVSWWTVGMTPWIIAGTSLFANNLCGEFPLVVLVAEFLSLVWVVTNESLSGSLTASTSSSELLTVSTSSLE